MIVARVNELYNSKGGGENNCPGETACEIFEAASGGTHEEKCQNSCVGCPMESTKPQSGDVPLSDNESRSILYAVEQIRRRRNSGGGINLEEISMLEWKLVLIWDDLTDSHERGLRLYSKALFEALATKGV